MPPGMNPLRIGAEPLTRALSIAHRGARAFAPENTLPSFIKATTLDCPMFELDVHLSKDGELVVHHDDRLTRCTDVAARFPGRGPYYVSDFSYDELRTLDAGSWFVDQLSLPPAQRQPFLKSLTDEEIEEFISPDERKLYVSGAVGLPTLAQTLDVASRAGIMVDIELKTLPRMYEGLPAAVVKLVRSTRMEERVLISSFDHQQLVAVRAISKVVAVGVLSSDRMARPGAYLRLLEADTYLPHGCGDHDSMGFGSISGRLDTSGIEEVRAGGGHVMVWTCNDEGQMRQLIAAGAGGIISDFPNRVRRVLDEGRGQRGGR